VRHRWPIATVLLVLAFLGARPWTWPFWEPAAQFAADQWMVAGATLSAALAILLLGAGAASLRLGRNQLAAGKTDESERWLEWLLSNRGMATVVATAATLGVIAMIFMLVVASGAKPDGAGNRNQLRIEAIKYGLGSFAAAGGLAALLLAVRRQRLAENAHVLAERTHALSEQAQQHTETDAAHRRITELFAKAVEQLGHNQAAVRLGGLYALERLAQDNPPQRQTVVNVLCAYLRMPQTALDASGGSLTTQAEEDASSPRNEIQVRLTAQRILSAHLTRRVLRSGHWVEPDNAECPENVDLSNFWPDLDLDLTGAILVDWDFSGGWVHRASFDKATFLGKARFERARFDGQASFTEAIFSDSAYFSETQFMLQVSFRQATFKGHCSFDVVEFRDWVWFTEAFLAEASFFRAAFKGQAHFGRAEFESVEFSSAEFRDQATFYASTFSYVCFDEVRFHDLQFNDATFKGETVFYAATFQKAMDFSGATFAYEINFDRAEVSLPRPAKDVLPVGWCVVSVVRDGRVVGALVPGLPASRSPDSNGHPSVPVATEAVQVPAASIGEGDGVEVG
jgi:uncharacterized protein YjbI with pentapeptide repeats